MLSNPPRALAPARLEELCVRQHGRQTVRAEHVEIPGQDLPLAHVDFDVGVPAERSGHHVLEGMHPGLLFREEPGHHLLVDPGVVLGEQLELAVAQTVGATVADVRHRDALAVEQHADDRRAHAVQRPVLPDRREDPLVGEPDGVAQPRCMLRRRADRQPFRLRRELVANGLHRDPRSDLAVAVTTHAVGHHEHLVLGIDLEAVLVVAAQHADVGQPARPGSEHQPPFPKNPPRPFLPLLRNASSACETTASSPPQVNASL